MSKVKVHPLDEEKAIIELTGCELRRLFYLMSKADEKHLPPAMLRLRDRIDEILDHVKVKEPWEA